MTGRSTDAGAEAHWEAIYATRAPSEVSWFQTTPTRSLALVKAAGIDRSQPVIDIGAGASTLVDELVALGFEDVSILDIAETALEAVRSRLGARAAAIHLLHGDVTRWMPPRKYALWHDRAVFHFLTEQEEREAYRRTLAAALAPGGAAIIATFSPDGPDRCSGLPVRRYSAQDLAAEFRGVLRLTDSISEEHWTPAGRMQAFVYALFVRV